MCTEKKSGIKRTHRLVQLWKNRLCAFWEWMLPYHKSPYYLKIYFDYQFYITEIQTKQERLKKLLKQNKIPKTFYRIINPNHHNSLLYLFYKLKFKAPKSYHTIHLQLNNTNILAKGQLITLNSRNSYCLKLRIIKQRNRHQILDQYQKLPTHIKNVGYRLYEDIHKKPIIKPINVMAIFTEYPYSRAILYNYFEKTIGTSPSTVWRDRRLIKYIFHLLDTDDSITDSYALFGFNSTSHLHRRFKQIFHISPLDFRNKYRGL